MPVSQPVAAAAPAPAPVAQPVVSQPTYVIEAPKQGMPAWAVVLIVATLLIGAGWAGITLLLPGTKSGGDTKAETKMTKPGDAAKQAHPFARHLEVTGLRVVETPKQKLMVQMIIVNHSAADLPDLTLEVRLRSTKAAADAEPISTFKVKVPSIAAYESKDVKAEAVTKLRAYEFPDWQFLQAEFDVKEQ